MLNCAEQVQIQKYKINAYKTLKTVGVQIITLKHPTKHEKKKKKRTSISEIQQHVAGTLGNSNFLAEIRLFQRV